MRRFLKNPRLLNSSLPQMSGTLRRKKDQTRLVLLFHRGKIKKCIEINKLKQLKNWNLPIVMLASLFSVQTEPDTVTCMLLPQKCSHLQVNTGCSTVLLEMLLSGMRLAINTTEVTFSFVCSPQGFFHSSLVSCRQNRPLS